MSEYEIVSTIINTLQVLVVVAGFAVAFRQLKILATELDYIKKDSFNSVELTSRQNAMNLIARYSDDNFVNRRMKLLTNKTSQRNVLECGFFLNFFEELSIAVKHNTANEDLLRDYFQTTLRFYYNQKFIKQAIEYRQKTDIQMFENMLWLYERWERKRVEPIRSLV